MKSVYVPEDFKITEFDYEDIITTSATTGAEERENAYGSFDGFDSPPDMPGSWY